MSAIRRLVLDVLKPHNPGIVELSRSLASMSGISGVNCSLDEVDQETESIKITIEGRGVDYDAVKDIIEAMTTLTCPVESNNSVEKLLLCP